MSRFCIFVAMTVFGWIGWWIGARYGFVTGFVVSTIASMIGVYAGWRIYNDYLS
jgi:hypothetical protein